MGHMNSGLKKLTLIREDWLFNQMLEEGSIPEWKPKVKTTKI